MQKWPTNTSHATFDDAVLDGVSLRGARMTQAKLRDASLKQTDLSDAILQDADFSGADCRSLILEGADTQGAVGLPRRGRGDDDETGSGAGDA
jgi:uncharacterized protein YjbI with pentapeptide repeats